ncbi:unnamed protein product [Mesocestoides corti]|uniref:Methyltransferase domain-containing protein n=1 Tax=Mesocestoides corti TaxID=53468 RepID=A0A3P6GJ58_MESCO|nr:unnamed protein product [Mesocestoides corti]
MLSSVSHAPFRMALTRARKRLQGGALLDVGCGTGILSIFGAKAGARHVFALDAVASLTELAKRIVDENGLADSITVLNVKVEDSQLPVDRVDALVSEWMGHALLYENMLSSVLAARDKYLRPPSTTASADDLAQWRRRRLFPCAATLFIAGFSEDVDDTAEECDSSNGIRHWEELSDLYRVELSGAFASAVSQEFESQVHVDVADPRSIVTTACALTTLDLATLRADEILTQGVKGSFEVKSMGTVEVSGFVIWFSVEFPDGDVLSTSPYKTPTHWQQSLIFLSKTLSMRQDDVLSGAVHFTHPSNARR